MIIATATGVVGGVASGIGYRTATRRHNSNNNIDKLFALARRRYQRWADDLSLPTEARELAHVYLALLDDPDLYQTIANLVRKGRPLAEAITSQFEKQARLLDGALHPYLRQRAGDLRSLGSELLGIEAAEGETGILLATSLTPLGLYEAYEKGVRGIVLLDTLSPTSHLAILAGTLGVSIVAGVTTDMQPWLGQTLSIDGATGHIWEGERLSTAQQLNIAPFPLWLNAASEREIATAHGYKGVGLFRTEFLYLQCGGVPTVDNEVEHYVAAVKAAGGKQIIFRLLDLGSDKPVAGLTLDREPNPMLGERGVRILLRRRDILERQLKALLTASTFGPLSIMVPMVVSPYEMAEVRAALVDLGGGHLPLGAMLETPASLLMIDEMCAVSDFFSLGTNDLSAYIYAYCRSSHVPLPDGADALFRLMGDAVRQAKQRGRGVGVCGELAGDPQYARRLLDIGCDYLSMVASAFTRVGEALQHSS